MYGGGHRQTHHHHHHYPNAHHKGLPPPGVAPSSPESAKATDIFELFIAASTFKSVLHHYRHICELLKLRPTNFRHFYPKLKSKIRSWKAQALWSKYDKRASHKCYNHGKAGENSKVLIIGAGPCGLRAAIEAQLLGAKVVVVEKRDRFSRNNVLHLWPFVIADLRALGAKKYYGKFCAGSIDHISIRQLQCILLKAALLLGVEVIEAVTFEELLEPSEDQSQRIGWHARFSPADHPVNQYEFDVLIGADGKRNTLLGFKRKEFRGKLAIAITANFINKHSEQEARVQEISGVAFIFNQKFFKDLYSETGIDLENIVYYKDETHYFVMTAKKHSLIDKGVILNDYPDTQQLLHPSNVDREALCDYAREAADFSTNGQLPHMDFAVNHYGKPDIAMFDFTSMFQADNACRVVEKHGHKLLQCLVGDSLIEPFWPTGSGCPRGFLSSFDACWAIRSWASGKMSPLEVISERESTYRLLAQTTPENLQKDITSYTLDPISRYQSVNLRAVLPFQVKSLYVTDNPASLEVEGNLQGETQNGEEIPRKRKRRDSTVHPDTLLSWVQKQVEVYPDIEVENMTTSFQDGRILCAIVHRYCPNLIDFESLLAEDRAENIQLAFDILEKDFAIPPVMTGFELANCDIPDKLTMMSYISQIYDVFRGEIPQFMGSKPSFVKNNVEMEDFPELQDSESHKDSNSSSPLRSKKEIPLRCRILDEPPLDSAGKEDFHLTKRRKNELGSSDKLDVAETESQTGKPRKPLDSSEPFSDRVKDLEAKFKGGSTQQKPKDMVRAIGKIEKTDWNLAAIEKKIEENVKPQSRLGERERVPKWSKDLYNDKHHNFERRLRENGEDEDRIAKYVEIDYSLKRLEKKLREGSTLETGLRGQNKVSNLANQLSSKFSRKDDEKLFPSKQTKPMVLQTGASDLCHFCNSRVYFVERLSAEGKFFHRKCFKCNYCGVLLRPGNYVYDRDGRYGGKFFCIPHLGMTSKSKGDRKQDSIELDKENRDLPPLMAYQDRNSAGGKDHARNLGGKDSTSAREPHKAGPPAGSPLQEVSPPSLTTPRSNLLSMSHLTSSLEDRGTTPERAEFENSVVQQSDEEEYLSEDEWTDRNFGASANELDESDDDSDYSDLGSDEEAEMEVYEGEHKLTIDETRRLAESWKRRYSTDALDDTDDDSELEIDTEDNLSEEHAADGDESHTATEEGEDGGGDRDDDDEDAEDVRKARELRRQEFNINFDAPPRVAETSDSGSETEVASDEESDTQIDTDSEFAEDAPAAPPKEIPTIVIESLDPQLVESSEPNREEKVKEATPGEPRQEHIQQKVELEDANQPAEPRHGDGAEKSASMGNLSKVGALRHRPEEQRPQQRLLQRTESTEAVSAQKNLQLRRQYLLGSSGTSPKKSVSTADLGNKFKSFMEKISETQKMLNPAPEPSPAMQAFLSSSSKTNLPPALSPRQGADVDKSPISALPPLPKLSVYIPDSRKPEEKEQHTSSESSKSDDGKVFLFPTEEEGKVSTAAKEEAARSPESETQPTLSDYDNVVPSEGVKVSGVSEVTKGLKDGGLEKDLTVDLGLGALEPARVKNGETCVDARNEDVISLFQENSKHIFDNASHSLNDLLDRDVIEAVNCDLVAPKDDPATNLKAEPELVEIKNPEVAEIESDIDKIFDELANDAIHEMELLKKSDSSKNLFLDLRSDDNSINMSDIDFLQEPLESVSNAKSSIKKNHEDISPTSALLDPSKSNASATESELSKGHKKPNTLNPKFQLEDPFESIAEIKEMDLMPSLDKTFSEYHLSATVQSPLARISSLESLEDSDTPLSKETTENRTASTTKLASEFAAKTDNMEFMDTSDSEGEDLSSPEGTTSPPITYDMLEEDTPTAPFVPLEAFLDSATDNKVSDSNFNTILPTFTSPTPDAESKTSKLIGMKSNSLQEEDQGELSTSEAPLRSYSEPPSIEESKKEVDSCTPSQRTPHGEHSTPKRYEACIPRFKDRVTPFRSARDSLDVKKNASLKPLFTPAKQNSSTREQAETSDSHKQTSQELRKELESKKEKVPSIPLGALSNCSPTESKSPPLVTAKSPISKPKDGDLVRDMVMSRITRKSPDKGTRRNSRTPLYPLSGSNSRSSLFDSKSSLEKSSESPVFNSSETEGSKSESISPPLIDRPAQDDKREMPDSDAKERSVGLLTDKPIFKPPHDLSHKADDKLPRKSPLPATPLTHPERFETSAHKRKEVLSVNKSCSSESPPVSSQGSSSLSESGGRGAAAPPRPVSAGAIDHLQRRAPGQSSETHKSKPKLDKEERLKELLAEHRRKEIEGQKDAKPMDRDRDSCVKECLEEYRQKRLSEPLPPSAELKLEKVSRATPSPVERRSYQEDATPIQNITPLLSSSNMPVFHRPSRLEIESMQVFTTSPKREPRLHFSSSDIDPSSSDFASPMLKADPMPQSELSKSTSAVNIEPPERRVKKSKDRERRRSLIQVFAGIFKSDEKKRASNPEEASVASPDFDLSKSTPNVSSPPPPLSPGVPVSPPPTDPPKSPSVRQRLSKLRLTRPKEKAKKERKSRSSSTGKVEGIEGASAPSCRGLNESQGEALSLPTSPSRTLFSFLSSARISDKNGHQVLPPHPVSAGPPPPQPTCRHSSSHRIQTPLPPSPREPGKQQRPYGPGSPPAIKEENYSDEETGSMMGGGTPEREVAGGHAQTPSLRRQKAALRAARQAKNKRLRMAQEIQRQLEEWEVQTRELEDSGVWVEQALRGETDASPKDEADLMRDWFALVHEKNALSRWGRELTVKAQELELEDRHVCLEDELRQRMACLESEKTRDDINREGIILSDMLRVLEEKESLAAQFEEDKRRYLEEDRDLEEIMLRKGLQRGQAPSAFPLLRPSS